MANPCVVVASFPLQKLVQGLCCLLAICLFGLVSPAWAQKRTVPVSESQLTGIPLPTGSIRDSRLLMEAAAEVIVDDEIQQSGTTLATIEVLSLPLSAPNAWADVLQQCTRAGWSIAKLNDPAYAWLNKEDRYVLAYFAASSKEQNLYFAEVTGKPANVAFSTDAQRPASTTNPQPKTPPTAATTNRPVTQTPAKSTAPATQPIGTSAIPSFAFTSTRFDDGWISTIHEDWVEVNRPGIRVRLHYPKEGTVFPANVEVVATAAWNILVAPQYTNQHDLFITYISSYEQPNLAMATATDKATGNDMFVVLFREGGSNWIEIAARDKNTFIQQFRFDPTTIRYDSDFMLTKPLLNLSGYNKFSVAASDLAGTWTSDFSGVTQLYHANTGQYAGMRMNQSSQTFRFTPGNRYNWRLLAVNSFAGSATAADVSSSGTFTVVNHWQVQCSDIEGKPKLYDAYFSCIKGTRILWLNDANAPGSGIFTGFALAK